MTPTREQTRTERRLVELEELQHSLDELAQELSAYRESLLRQLEVLRHEAANGSGAKARPAPEPEPAPPRPKKESGLLRGLSSGEPLPELPAARRSTKPAPVPPSKSGTGRAPAPVPPSDSGTRRAPAPVPPSDSGTRRAPAPVPPSDSGTRRPAPVPPSKPGTGRAPASASDSSTRRPAPVPPSDSETRRPPPPEPTSDSSTRRPAPESTSDSGTRRPPLPEPTSDSSTRRPAPESTSDSSTRRPAPPPPKAEPKPTRKSDSGAPRDGKPISIMQDNDDDEPATGWVVERSANTLRIIVEEQLVVGSVYNIKPAKEHPNAQWVQISIKSCHQEKQAFAVVATFIVRPPWTVLALL